MLLRRITSHVKDQNWTAVALDFAIVVLGVFIGLQVANWNDDRQARKEEKAYLVRLHEDFASSITANRNMIGFMEAQIQNNLFAIEALEECSLAIQDRDRFAAAMVSIGKVIPTQLFDATIEELNSTGKFHYIQSDQLRSAILRHLDAIEVEQSIMRAVEQRAIPHTVYVESQIGYRIAGIGDLDNNPSWQQIDINFKRLCGDERFRRAISINNLYIADIAGRVNGNIADQLAILQLLEAELE